MAVLMIRANGALGEALARRLIAQDDEVRVVEPAHEAVEPWSALGVHVARGDDSDADLIERAAQNVRTLVLVEEEAGSLAPVVAPVIAGAVAARVGRIVAYSLRPDETVWAALAGSGLEHVLLSAPRRRSLFGGRARLSVEVIAEALDAADDIAGSPRLRLDLGERASWAALGLRPPEGL